MSLLRANMLDPVAKRRFYGRLVPPRCWEHLAQIDAGLAGGVDNLDAFRLIAPVDRAEVHLRAPATRIGGDYALSLDLEEAGGGQLELSFIVINDLTAQRYNIDVTESGEVTLLGTAGRNLQQELAAMRAGLGPCQVRRGLGLFADLLPALESVAGELGYVAIALEPLTYHNAVMYEHYGFGYIAGRKRMMQINREFAPGGALRKRMDASTPFRMPAMADTARGRSWAIHDGILREFNGAEALEVKMFKVLGQDAGQRTFSLSG
jgi:hypothetical protein